MTEAGALFLKCSVLPRGLPLIAGEGSTAYKLEMPLGHIEQFLGYGPSDPRVVFVGTEESDGGAEPVENVRIRLARFMPTMDLFIGSEILESAAGFTNPFKRSGNYVQQWSRAAEFRLALAGLETNEETVSRYWREFLGRERGDTFLMECFPIPRRLSSQAVAHYDAVGSWSSRRERLRDFTRRITPAFVIAYGKPARDRIEELFPVRTSIWNGQTTVWHGVPGARATIALSEWGAAIARTEFFGQGRFRRSEISPIARALIDLRGSLAPLMAVYAPLSSASPPPHGAK